MTACLRHIRRVFLVIVSRGRNYKRYKDAKRRGLDEDTRVSLDDRD